MTPAPAPRPRPGVLSGGHRALSGLLVLLLLAAAAPAGDDDGERAAPPPEGGRTREARRADGGGEGSKASPGAGTRKRSEDEVLLGDLGAAWKARDAKAVAARFPAKRKVALRLPGVEEGEYRAEQARSLLADSFAGRTFARVELRGVREGTATFRTEWVRAADRRRFEGELVLALATEEGKRVLVRARESP
jgi:hypothetical protein